MPTLTSTPTVNDLSQSLSTVTELIWLEATLLDHRQYDKWLELWDPSGIYVVPIDPETEDFENSLNYVYDDHDMRKKRVERMMAGTAGSVVDAARTVRTVSRFVFQASPEDGVVEVCAAQILVAYKRGVSTIFAADVTYRVRIDGTHPRIQQKIVRLVDATGTLNSIGFFL